MAGMFPKTIITTQEIILIRNCFGQKSIIIIDSIDKGVPIYQTFPLARLESNYYKLY